MIVVKGGRLFNVILPITVLPNDVRKGIVLFLNHLAFSHHYQCVRCS